MATPYEVTSAEGLSDPELQKMFAQQLRKNRDIANLSTLTGDRVLANFGNQLIGDTSRQEGDAMSGRSSELNRQLTGQYYDQQAGQSALSRAMEMLRLQETIRHNKAMEGNRTNQLDADTRRLAQELTKNNVPEIQTAINEINTELANYQNGNLPGVGGLANLLPSMTKGGRTMQDSIAKIRNIILKARSGGAVTPQEADRLLQEFSMRGFNTDEDFLRAWGDFTRAFDNGVANIYAGYPQETVQQYNTNLAREQAQETRRSQPQQQQGTVSWSEL